VPFEAAPTSADGACPIFLIAMRNRVRVMEIAVRALTTDPTP
jgi:hypothetical protein